MKNCGITENVNVIARTPFRQRIAAPLRILILAAILFAPSAWLMTTVPPLWRDGDGYNQVVLPPALSASLGHSPLYCVLVRVPLFLGYQIERFRGKAAPVTENFFSHPQLTDNGVFLLVLSQHLGLCAAIFVLITTITGIFLIRIFLALLWASNALFYTFAQCVSSETLSLILIIAFATIAFHLCRSASRNWKTWGAYALLLWLCCLSRYVNLFLALILPLTFAASAAIKFGLNRFTKFSQREGGPRKTVIGDLKIAFVALAIGLACVGLGVKTIEVLSNSGHFRYYSPFGFTFLWRLRFLNDLPKPQRDALLDQVDARTKSPEAHQLILVLRELLDEETGLHPHLVVERARSVLPPTKVPGQVEHFDPYLNELAAVFLTPPTSAHWQATWKDFDTARRMPLATIPSSLFITTAFYFDHTSDMRELSKLVTFRNSSAAQVIAIPSEHAYFQLWKHVSYNFALIFWILGLGALLIRAPKSEKSLMIIAYGISLNIVGALTMFAPCLVGERLPRYAFPMWELLFIAFTIYAAALLAIGGSAAPSGDVRN
jgi:hypothetical protein